MNLFPKTLEWLSVDPVSEKYIVRLKNGKDYEFYRDPDDNTRFLLLGEDKQRKINILGGIYVGSPRSGAMFTPDFMPNNCIGEYDLTNGEYTVIPYENTRKFPERKEQIHPLEYLLKHLD